jgi:ABC-type multidrug transport system ATPase subunit
LTGHVPPALLEARGISHAFRRRPVLHGASLAIGGGTIAGVVGENGTGKTTLLRILAGLLAPDEGDVRVAGRLGYCPQGTDLFELLTVREHLRLFAGALDLPSREDHAERLLARLALRPHADTLVRDASGGTRQKLNLALALLGDPDVLLLDEPYAAFDWQTYVAFWDLAAELRARGRAVLLVSHLVHDRERVDRLWALSDGVLRCA